jgi:hypothetical protein
MSHEPIVSPHHSADVSNYRWYPCNHDGHIGRSIDRDDGSRRSLYLHQHVWQLEHGTLPAKGLTIDHIDRNPSNNCIENLRPATPRLQGLNANRGGTKELPRGVSRAGRRFRAQVSGPDGKPRRFGPFNTVAEAEAAYQSALADAIAEEEQRSWELFEKQKKEINSNGE